MPCSNLHVIRGLEPRIQAQALRIKKACIHWRMDGRLIPALDAGTAHDARLIWLMPCYEM